MLERLTVTCPHCAFSKVVSKSVIPASSRQATCPRCKRPFSLNVETLRAYVAPLAAIDDRVPVPPPLSPTIPVRSSPSPADPRTLAFIFHGSTRDYFGVWVVNTLLKMLTFGFYSAWAKVRKRRFFYGSTTLHGQPFEYLADPMALFKGWLVAAAAFILYAIGSRVSPLLSGTIAMVVFAAFPWLLVRSRIYNATNSTYRNIRFGFRPNYREAYVVFAGLTILSMISLGLLAPYMLYRQKKFIVENSTYGSTPFTFSATVKDFYTFSLKVALGFGLIVALVGGMMALSGGALRSAATGGGRHALSGLALIPALTLPLVYFLVIVYAQTAIANLSWNGTRLGDGGFRSTLRTWSMALLFVTNGLAILFSLGLLMPWATVRLARYRFENLVLVTSDDLDGVISAFDSITIGATGEEIGDVFDMPIDIAL